MVAPVICEGKGERQPRSGCGANAGCTKSAEQRPRRTSTKQRWDRGPDDDPVASSLVLEWDREREWSVRKSWYLNISQHVDRRNPNR